MQDILLDTEFENLTKSFSLKYCMEFEATEENKLCYTSIFKEYQTEIEGYLMKRLAEDVPDFSMEYFSNEL
jgi:ADP-ribosylation factor 2-binding protein